MSTLEQLLAERDAIYARRDTTDAVTWLRTVERVNGRIVAFCREDGRDAAHYLEDKEPRKRRRPTALIPQHLR